ncbi:MAG: hypothetical protein ACLUQN_07390, partial [Megasphaera sp.]|uniref:hypothetical protein n=1 Tax=Megasphaera massiliensis TaxID=1232428 RepID=UPI001D05DCA6
NLLTPSVTGGFIMPIRRQRQNAAPMTEVAFFLSSLSLVEVFLTSSATHGCMVVMLAENSGEPDIF